MSVFILLSWASSNITVEYRFNRKSFCNINMKALTTLASSDIYQNLPIRCWNKRTEHTFRTSKVNFQFSHVKFFNFFGHMWKKSFEYFFVTCEKKIPNIFSKFLFVTCEKNFTWIFDFFSSRVKKKSSHVKKFRNFSLKFFLFF